MAGRAGHGSAMRFHAREPSLKAAPCLHKRSPCRALAAMSDVSAVESAAVQSSYSRKLLEAYASVNAF
jgi:hypothetical protein